MASHVVAPLREHIAYQLLYELRDAPVGRRTLVERTGLTESVVRTELKKLEAQKFVSFSKLGTALTARGRQFLAKKLSPIADVRDVQLQNLMLDRCARMAHIRGGADGFSAWLYRDVAVREGATATLLLTKRKGALCFIEGHEALAAQNPADSEILERAFPTLNNGDLIVIVFGPTKGAVARGLWAVLWALASNL
ncbi:MAG: DUF4443 domain-containing protein [Candidatus Bipolaricaulia bacterium]